MIVHVINLIDLIFKSWQTRGIEPMLFKCWAVIIDIGLTPRVCWEI